MLLEVLSDFQISIPELGVIEARTRPLVVLTSNNSANDRGAPPVPVPVARLSGGSGRWRSCGCTPPTSTSTSPAG